ncbi:hypothetical protein NDU88_011872 [Pleurodeles waltl]|uniref:Uncharacterized protein n=1 Tax=Pleurodeles waltl TaxID=8319 RepID=A0AAV7R2M2_PLEWA|nr:hypothetical protein NDU88_011872 [Pleurodeles waltl]
MLIEPLLLGAPSNDGAQCERIWRHLQNSRGPVEWRGNLREPGDPGWLLTGLSTGRGDGGGPRRLQRIPDGSSPTDQRRRRRTEVKKQDCETDSTDGVAGEFRKAIPVITLEAAEDPQPADMQQI